MITNITEQFPEASTPVVSLDLAKSHLRVDSDFTAEDVLIQAYIDAAVIATEQHLNGYIMKRTLIVSLDAVNNPLILDIYPIRAVTSVSYYLNGQNMSTNVDNERILFSKPWPKSSSINFLDQVPQLATRSDAATITIEVGFEVVPSPIIAAILLQIADLYERREDRGEIGYNSASQNLLRPYRKP